MILNESINQSTNTHDITLTKALVYSGNNSCYLIIRPNIFHFFFSVFQSTGGGKYKDNNNPIISVYIATELGFGGGFFNGVSNTFSVVLHNVLCPGCYTSSWFFFQL